MVAQLWPLLMLDVGRPFRDAHCFVPQTEAAVRGRTVRPEEQQGREY